MHRLQRHKRQKIRFKGLWKQFITWFCLVISFPFQIAITFLQVGSRKGKDIVNCLLKIWLKATIQIFLIFKCLSVQNCSWLNTFCPTVLLVQIININTHCIPDLLTLSPASQRLTSSLNTRPSILGVSPE